MLEMIENKINQEKNKEEKVNLLREFLQVFILKIIRDKNAFLNISFVGGTCLRIVYDLKRYSEDLDFSLTTKKNYEFVNLLEKLKKELELHNIQTELKYKTGIVDSCFVKFNSVLQYFGLNKHKDEKLSVKLEIDTNPPKGAKLEEKLINNHFIFNLITYDLPSLMAGKLHAVLCRKYAKGRDYYDLLWYLTKNINPNITLLNNAILQTEKDNWNITPKNWKENLLKKLKGLNYKKIQSDVSPFLQTKEEASMIQLNTFEKLLRA